MYGIDDLIDFALFLVDFVFLTLVIFALSLPISPNLFLSMMSIAIHTLQRDVLSHIPVVGIDIHRDGSDIRTSAISSYYSNNFVHSSDLVCLKLLHHPCLAMASMPFGDQLFMLPVCLIEISVVQTHRPHSVQVTEPPNVIKPLFDVSCASVLKPSTSRLTKLTRSVQLFIKSVRNTTISIHIDSTSSISDLKHLIYAHDGIPPCVQRLMHRGRELRDDALLSGLDVDGATITCLLRVLGGNLKTHKLPIHWWFGFSRSYEDGRAGEEGRICHVLSEIEFGGACPHNWCTDLPLPDWYGIGLYPGIVLIGLILIF